MKNLFISVPMSGFSDEQIDIMVNKLYSIAAEHFGDRLRIIPTIIEEEMSPIGYLARSIELMDSADYFIGVDMTGSISFYRGCAIENMVAEYYGIPYILVNINVLLCLFMG